ncbi:MAG: DUF47 family protein [Kofleriaceae bacterium]
MGFQALVRWLLPKEDHFYAFIERQAVAAHDGALALAKSKEEGASSEAIAKAVQAVEHQGDSIVHDLEEALARTFVTPIDREDLQKLSSQLDDVLDLTNSAARAVVLFRVKKPTPAMTVLIDCLVSCTALLKEALPALRNHAYPDLTTVSRQLRKLEKEADVVYREAVRGLFGDDEVSAKELLREKQVLDDLERAIDRCEYVADTLANLAVKHG